ncbi:MAG: S1C family serine protease [Fidelibacterota bacterium]
MILSIRHHLLRYCLLVPTLGLTVLPGSDLTRSRQTAITEAIEKVGPAVASINVIQVQPFFPSQFFKDPFFEFWLPEELYRQKVKSLGSGIVISPDGYILTNQHVVEGAVEIVVTLPGGKEYTAEVVGEDRTTDIAVLKISGKDIPYAELGDSDDIIIGEWVVALGNPFGLFDVNKQPTATVGIVSAVNLDFGREHSGRIYQGMIQTDAAINRGNSGGPLCNANGEVIGLNTFIFTGGAYSEGSIGIGFAIPINRAKSIAEELKKHGRIDRRVELGFRFQPVDRALGKYLRLPESGGIIVTQVLPAGERAGLQVGDVIYEINGRQVNSSIDIVRIIQENYLGPGDKLKITFYRDGKIRSTQLVLSGV